MIYFDNAATTKVDPEVIEEMIPYFKKYYGNPSSLHNCGKDARKAIENARFRLSDILNCVPNEIIFTSGATESNNLVVKSCVDLCNKLEPEEKKHFIFSSIEHKSVLNLEKTIEENGHEIDFVNCIPSGQIDLEHLESLINDNTILISCIHVNNETGIIQPIETISEICKERDILFHVDATQSFSKIKLDLNSLWIDFLSFSGHKLHGPKGIGGLYKNRSAKLECQIVGGSQEDGYRSGTENVPGIIGLAKAAEINDKKFDENDNHFKKLENYFFKKLDCSKQPFIINGSIEHKVPWIFNIAFLDFLAVDLEEKLNKFCFSKSSACSKGNEPSYVLKAMKIPEDIIERSIRLSFSRFNTMKHIDCFFEGLEKLKGVI